MSQLVQARLTSAGQAMIGGAGAATQLIRCVQLTRRLELSVAVQVRVTTFGQVPVTTSVWPTCTPSPVAVAVPVLAGSVLQLVQLSVASGGQTMVGGGLPTPTWAKLCWNPAEMARTADKVDGTVA